MNNTASAAELIGRTLLAAIFLVSGLGKITAFAGTQAYMESAGVPGVLLPLVIALEVGGALAVIAGLATRITAVLLAGFTLATAVLFHSNLGDAGESIQFLKNLAIAGGFLLLASRGAGPLSVDHWRGQTRPPTGRRVTS